MFFINEKLKVTTFELSENSATVAWVWLRIKMETKKIANLLGDSDGESSNFATKNGMLSMIKITNYGEGNENG